MLDVLDTLVGGAIALLSVFLTLFIQRVQGEHDRRRAHYDQTIGEQITRLRGLQNHLIADARLIYQTSFSESISADTRRESNESYEALVQLLLGSSFYLPAEVKNTVDEYVHASVDITNQLHPITPSTTSTLSTEEKKALTASLLKKADRAIESLEVQVRSTHQKYLQPMPAFHKPKR